MDPTSYHHHQQYNFNPHHLPNMADRAAPCDNMNLVYVPVSANTNVNIPMEMDIMQLLQNQNAEYCSLRTADPTARNSNSTKEPTPRKPRKKRTETNKPKKHRPPKRKRIADPNKHKRVIRRNQRNMGMAYVNTRGKAISAREIGKACTCPLKCWDKLDGKESKIFDGFWELADFNIQNAYLFSCVRAVGIKRRYGKGPPEMSRRQNSYLYFVKVNGKDLRVCQQAFLAVHGLQKSRGRVSNILKHVSEGYCVPKKDQRGKHTNRPNRKKTDNEDAVSEQSSQESRTPNPTEFEPIETDLMEPSVIDPVIYQESGAPTSTYYLNSPIMQQPIEPQPPAPTPPKTRKRSNAPKQTSARRPRSTAKRKPTTPRTRKGKPKMVDAACDLSIPNYYHDFYVPSCHDRNQEPLSQEIYQRALSEKYNFGFRTMPHMPTNLSNGYGHHLDVVIAALEAAGNV